MGKICRIKQRTKTSKKRKRFLGKRRQLVNNGNTGINLWTVNNETKNDNLNIHDQSEWWYYPLILQERLLKVIKRFLFLKHPQYLHLKWMIQKENYPKGKNFWELCCWCIGTLLSSIFVEMLYVMPCVCECSSLALYERREKKRTIIFVIFKMLHQQLQIYLWILCFSKSKQKFWN